jgi:hypothetical protein
MENTYAFARSCFVKSDSLLREKKNSTINVKEE